jgi:hypothetical protein
MRSQAEGLAEEPEWVPGVVGDVEIGVVRPPVMNNVLLV